MICIFIVKLGVEQRYKQIQYFLWIFFKTLYVHLLFDIIINNANASINEFLNSFLVHGNIFLVQDYLIFHSLFISIDILLYSLLK